MADGVSTRAGEKSTEAGKSIPFALPERYEDETSTAEVPSACWSLGV